MENRGKTKEDMNKWSQHLSNNDWTWNVTICAKKCRRRVSGRVPQCLHVVFLVCPSLFLLSHLWETKMLPLARFKTRWSIHSFTNWVHHSTTRSVEASRVQRMMGTHGPRQLSFPLPSTLLYFGWKKVDFLPRGPAVWQHWDTFVTTIFISLQYDVHRSFWV